MTCIGRLVIVAIALLGITASGFPQELNKDGVLKDPGGKTGAALALEPGGTESELLLEVGEPKAKDREKEKALPQPRVVRTWDELLGSEPIALADGPKVRLGLEARKVPPKSAFLVYALVDTEDRIVRGSFGGECLGPLQVEISRVIPPSERREIKEKLQQLRAESRVFGKRVLFAQTLIVERPGDYVVTFRANDVEVARTTITATENATAEEAQSWLTLRYTGEVRDKLTKKGEDPRVSWVIDEYQTGALPFCDGKRPLLSDAKDIPPRQPLPR